MGPLSRGAAGKFPPMTTRARLRSILRRCSPRRLRVELYHLRRLGPGGYTRNKWRKHATRGGQEPRANAPFDIGAPVPITLHESTVPGVVSHWVDRGQGTEELDAFRRVAPGHSTFLDIGAAQGIFSAAFCALTDRRAYAFEPSPTMFEGLVALIDLNPDFKITPFQLALGAKAGSQAVESRGAQFRGVRSAQANADTMSVETLDNFVALHGLAPDFVKIDVEGMELDVLRGGAQTFSGPVAAIMLEVHPRILMQGEGIAGVQELLNGFGFRLFTLDFAPIAHLADSLVDRRGRPLRAMNIVCQRSSPQTD
jgi:FkbM family methyltransferase